MYQIIKLKILKTTSADIDKNKVEDLKLLKILLKLKISIKTKLKSKVKNIPKVKIINSKNVQITTN
jgi:hypothetical protein